MTQSSMHSEIQCVLAQIAALNERYERSVLNDEISGAANSIKNSIKKLQEQLEKMQEKLFGVSIE
jgi:predicted ATP-grasp superfamily ATP-dependent carboligase